MTGVLFTSFYLFYIVNTACFCFNFLQIIEYLGLFTDIYLFLPKMIKIKINRYILKICAWTFCAVEILLTVLAFDKYDWCSFKYRLRWVFCVSKMLGIAFFDEAIIQKVLFIFFWSS